MSSRCYKSLCFAVLAALCGCGQADSLDTSAEEESLVTAEVAIEQSIVVSDNSAEDSETTESAAAGEDVAAQDSIEPFQPPYPDRVNLFLAPKREGRSTHNDQEGAVELLGFVNVDRRRAVLMINGAVYPIAEGDSQFGIEVISIQPPGVVLQRGRQRWQATLEN